MPAFVFTAGFDTARVPWKLTALGPRFSILEGRAAGHALLQRLAGAHGSVALVGPWLPDMTQAEAIRRIRAQPTTRPVSIVALVKGDTNAIEGANAVLPLSADTPSIERCVSRLLSVSTRARVAARVCGEDLSLRQPFEGMTQNISATGMRVVSPARVSVGDDLDLRVTAGSSRVLPVLGRVVRTEPLRGDVHLGYGIEFLYVPPATEEAIARMVERSSLARETADAILLGSWTYEILDPIHRDGRWEAEVWRSPHGQRRGVRFLCVAGSTPRNASREAREILLAWALVRSGAAQMTHIPLGNAC